MESIILKIINIFIKDNIILLYIFFFFSQALQVLFPPYPGDMILVIEGYLSQVAKLNIYLILIVAWLGTFISSVILFKFGYMKQSEIQQSKLINFLIDTKKILKVSKILKKYSFITIILGKFIPGIYSIVILLAGIFKLNSWTVYITIGLTNFIHHSIFILLGKKLGENWVLIIEKLRIYQRYILFLVFISLIIYLLFHRIKKKYFV